jgi:hypothetical protein
MKDGIEPGERIERTVWRPACVLTPTARRREALGRRHVAAGRGGVTPCGALKDGCGQPPGALAFARIRRRSAMLL